MRERFTSSSPSLAKSNTFTSSGTFFMFFFLCLVAEKALETGKNMQNCIMGLELLVFLEWFFIFVFFRLSFFFFVKKKKVELLC